MPVMTTCSAHNEAEAATSQSPRDKAVSDPPPSSHVPKNDSTVATQIHGPGLCPSMSQARKGVITTYKAVRKPQFVTEAVTRPVC